MIAMLGGKAINSVQTRRYGKGIVKNAETTHLGNIRDAVSVKHTQHWYRIQCLIGFCVNMGSLNLSILLITGSVDVDGQFLFFEVL